MMFLGGHRNGSGESSPAMSRAKSKLGVRRVSESSLDLSASSHSERRRSRPSQARDLILYDFGQDVVIEILKAYKTRKMVNLVRSKGDEKGDYGYRVSHANGKPKGWATKHGTLFRFYNRKGKLVYETTARPSEGLVPWSPCGSEEEIMPLNQAAKEGATKKHTLKQRRHQYGSTVPLAFPELQKDDDRSKFKRWSSEMSMQMENDAMEATSSEEDVEEEDWAKNVQGTISLSSRYIETILLPKGDRPPVPTQSPPAERVVIEVDEDLMASDDDSANDTYVISASPPSSSRMKAPSKPLPPLPSAGRGVDARLLSERLSNSLQDRIIDIEANGGTRRQKIRSESFANPDSSSVETDEEEESEEVSSVVGFG